MPPTVKRVEPDAIGSFLHATPYALLRLERAGPIELHRGVAEFFDAAWPRLFSFGTLERRQLREPSWLEQVFRTQLGPLRGGVRDGYYLFERGVVVGHHRGVVSTGVGYEGVDLERRVGERREPAVSPPTIDRCRRAGERGHARGGRVVVDVADRQQAGLASRRRAARLEQVAQRAHGSNPHRLADQSAVVTRSRIEGHQPEHLVDAQAERVDVPGGAQQRIQHGTAQLAQRIRGLSARLRVRVLAAAGRGAGRAAKRGDRSLHLGAEPQ